MRTVLIEGWRGICQSFSMVNQYQLLELLNFTDLKIWHSDLPLVHPRWSAPENVSDFPTEMQRRILALKEPEGDQFDVVYRIGFPYQRTWFQARRVVTFMVTEFGLGPRDFSPQRVAPESFCSGNDIVVTPSSWSKNKLIEVGFPSERVSVIPHGVNTDIFFPASATERSDTRAELEIEPEHFVFLNLGSLSLNKGIETLIKAFSHIHRRHNHTRLVLKDSSGLYGTTVEGFFGYFTERNGSLPQEVLEAIYVVPPNLTFDEMRLLYGASDAYVSPYSAEGFNLPVIEAIACGIPAIVTAGGATDDYCDASTALKISSERVSNAECGIGVPGYQLRPHMDSLLEQMETAILGNLAVSESFGQGRRHLIETYTWESAARQLAALF